MTKDYIKYISVETIDKIHDTAAELHESVNQRYGDYPYEVHLNLVALCLPLCLPIEKFDDISEVPAVVFGAYFHDSIEDARVTYNDVLKIATRVLDDKHNAELATEIVYALTNEKGRNRKERANEKYYECIRNTKYAKYVKLADRMANVLFSKYQEGSRMYGVYLKEMDEFMSHLFSPEEIDVQALMQEIDSLFSEIVICLNHESEKSNVESNN